MGLDDNILYLCPLQKSKLGQNPVVPNRRIKPRKFISYIRDLGSVNTTRL